MLKIVDTQKDATQIFSKAVKAATEATRYIAYFDMEMVMGMYVITVQTDIPRGVGDLIEGIISKSARGQLVKTECHQGHFDWASDTYIKDQVLVWFKV